MSPTVSLIASCLCTVTMLLMLAVPSARAMPTGPLDIDSQLSGPDMVILTLCWDGHKINPECRRSRLLLPKLVSGVLSSRSSLERDDYRERDLEEVTQEDQVRPSLRMPSKGKRRDNSSGFYSNW